MHVKRLDRIGVGKTFYLVFTYGMISHYIERKVKKGNETALS